MENLKNLVFGLFILLEIFDLLLVVGYSEVSSSYTNSEMSTEYLVPRMSHPSKRKYINLTSEKFLRYLGHVEVILTMANKEIVLDLRLNHKILSRNFKQVYYENGDLKVVQPLITDLDYCHYTGQIKDENNSWAAISTCDGISGIIFDGFQHYLIEKSSRNDTYLHQIKVSPSSSYITNNSTNRRKRETRNNISEMPYTENENSRYIKLALVFDNELSEKLGGFTEVTKVAITMTNQLNAIYSRVNIFVILVVVAVWKKPDNMSLAESVCKLTTDEMSHAFVSYVETELAKNYNFNSAHLITRVRGGMYFSYSGPCTAIAVGTHTYKGVITTASFVAHGLGHNLGLKTDAEDCTCPEEYCIMHTSTFGGATYFSSCSIDSLRKLNEDGKHYCFKNKPDFIENNLSVCGNGIQEIGEECDCGLQTNCKNQCCDALTCTLKNNAQCATGTCCDSNTCKLKDAATVCRQTSNECDLSEYCTGESQNCPEDTFKLDTKKCNDGKSYCHQGVCGYPESRCLAAANTNLTDYWECNQMKSDDINENNYCKNNMITAALFKCGASWFQFTACEPKYETIMFGLKAVGIHTLIYATETSTVVCTLTMTSNDVVAVQDAKLCNSNPNNCSSMSILRNYIPICPIDCHDNGWCNNKGQCHCKDGYDPPDCSGPGSGGSLLSGPSSDPFVIIRQERIKYIIIGMVLCIGLPAIIFISIKIIRDRKSTTRTSQNISKRVAESQNRKLISTNPQNNINNVNKINEYNKKNNDNKTIDREGNIIINTSFVNLTYGTSGTSKPELHILPKKNDDVIYMNVNPKMINFNSQYGSSKDILSIQNDFN